MRLPSSHTVGRPVPDTAVHEVDCLSRRYSKQGHKSKFSKEAFGKGLVQVRRTGRPPWPGAIGGGTSGPRFAEAAFHQVLGTGRET